MVTKDKELSDLDKRQVVLSEEDKVPKTSFLPIALPEKLNAYNMNYDKLTQHKRYVYEDILRICMSAKVPVTLWGPPGAGKTKTIQALEKECDEDGVNYQVITVQPSTEDATVFNGLMTVIYDNVEQKYITEKSIPRVAERIWEEYKYHRRLTILFLDEMTTCVPAQQHAMLGLLTDGTYGSMDISPYITCVMAANPPNTVPETIPLGNQVINRGGHIPWYSEQEKWYDLYIHGFGNPNRIKPDGINEDLRNYMNIDGGGVFTDPKIGRDDVDEEEIWTPDNLVPYDQIAPSERSVTAFMDIYQVILTMMNDLPYDVRRLYVKECALAFLGKKEADKWGRIYDMRASRVDTAPVISAVTRANIDFNSTLDDITAAVGDKLHRLEGRMMTSSKEHEMAQLFEKQIYDGRFAIQRYLAFWVWLATSTNEATRAQVIPIAINIMRKATDRVTSQEHGAEIPRSNILPAFVPPKIRSEISELWSQHKRQ